MHPAKSVIFFTTASGAGYGLAFWLCLLGAFGLAPADTMFGVVAFGVALLFIIAGLLSSTFHLGHPERAWRALSQWRSSWLSREGVAAITAFAPIGVYAIGWVVFGTTTGVMGLVGIIAAAAAMATVYCTSMIYASLRSIPAWSNRWTPMVYIVLSLSSGGVLAAFLFSAWRFDIARGWALIAAMLVVAGLIVKLAYWRSVATAPARSTAESATGLGQFGSVRLIDAPHSQSSYLLDEMGFRVARKHAEKLRRIAIFSGFVGPAALLALAPLAGAAASAVTAAAVIAGAIGLAAERWLFFAEARHVVTLYYGESQA
ncbi:MAG: dimethyl sulfoxide reductase anchor subunit [Parvularculaceae bacterium]|nr:dimethyl sulfoxide reductase anchor subunit [Parvularculaceae bacterium]